MEPYNPNKSFISMKLDGSLLDKMVEAGIPLTRALQYFRDNPEGPASETLNLATDEMVPFKYQIRSGQATPASLAEEAVLMFKPIRGGNRRTVRVDKKGIPNREDLREYAESKREQLNRLAETVDEHNHNPIQLAEQYKYDLDEMNKFVNSYESKLKAVNKILSDPEFGNSEYALNLKNDLNQRYKEMLPRKLELENKYNEAVINSLNGEDIRTYRDIVNEMAPGFVPDDFLRQKFINEYGPIQGEIYYNNAIKDIYHY